VLAESNSNTAVLSQQQAAFTNSSQIVPPNAAAGSKNPAENPTRKNELQTQGNIFKSENAEVLASPTVEGIGRLGPNQASNKLSTPSNASNRLELSPILKNNQNDGLSFEDNRDAEEWSQKGILNSSERSRAGLKQDSSFAGYKPLSSGPKKEQVPGLLTGPTAPHKNSQAQLYNSSAATNQRIGVQTTNSAKQWVASFEARSQGRSSSKDNSQGRPGLEAVPEDWQDSEEETGLKEGGMQHAELVDEYYPELEIINYEPYNGQKKAADARGGEKSGGGGEKSGGERLGVSKSGSESAGQSRSESSKSYISLLSGRRKNKGSSAGQGCPFQVPSYRHPTVHLSDVFWFPPQDAGRFWPDRQADNLHLDDEL
jgi:hypothetical protein